MAPMTGMLLIPFSPAEVWCMHHSELYDDTIRMSTSDQLTSAMQLDEEAVIIVVVK